MTRAQKSPDLDSDLMAPLAYISVDLSCVPTSVQVNGRCVASDDAAPIDVRVHRDAAPSDVHRDAAPSDVHRDAAPSERDEARGVSNVKKDPIAFLSAHVREWHSMSRAHVCSTCLDNGARADRVTTTRKSLHTGVMSALLGQWSSGDTGADPPGRGGLHWTLTATGHLGGHAGVSGGPDPCR